MKKYFLVTVIAFIALIIPISVFAEGEPTLNWIEGPTKVSLGENLATFNVPESMVYLDKENTIEFNKSLGNAITYREIGMVAPKDQNQNWYVVFEYEESGHIPDNEKDNIDTSELLQSYKEGTEESNKEREKQGIPPFYVTGWDIEPHYNDQSHNLEWSLLLEDEFGKFVNYNTNILSRNGYISVVMVADSADVGMIKPQLQDLIQNISFNPGERYEDYDPKVDKLADFGLTALIAGGAGVALAKKGIFVAILLFFKKFFVVILAAIAGLGKIFWSKLRRQKNEQIEIND